MSRQLYTGEVRTIGESMARSTTEAGVFKLFMDEPPELGIPVTGTEISVKGSLDPAKFAGTDRTVRAGYQSLEVTIHVKSTANSDDIARLKSEVEARCPVSDNLANATPVHLTMRAV